MRKESTMNAIHGHLARTIAAVSIALSLVPESNAQNASALAIPTPARIDSAPAAPPGRPSADIAIGFGSHVAIASAMAQVVPPGHVVRFADGAHPTTPVDWSGGRPWQQVAASMATAAGYELSIDGTTIVVRPHRAPSTETARAASRGETHRAADRAFSGETATRPPRENGTRFDSPTVDRMSPEQAAAETPAPIGTPIQLAPTPAMASRTIVSGYPIAPLSQPPYSAVSRGRADGELLTDGVAMQARGYASDRTLQERVWHASSNDTLAETLRKWCALQGGGWSVDTQTDIAYMPRTSMDFTGDLPHAVRDFVNAVHAPIMPYAHIHLASKNIVLVDAEHNSISADQ